jgi:putative transcriptional regulator
VRRARQKLRLTQKEFAHRFDINLRRLQDWEQGRVAPDSAILAYLKVIEREPELVRRILEKA